MQFKIATDYAIRIVYYLAKNRKITNSKELSDRLGIPQSTVLKIGKELSEHEIINITTGILGGFLLIKQPNEITMYDIINMFEPTIKINRCLEEDQLCSRNAVTECPVRTIYSNMQECFENKLKSISMKDLILQSQTKGH